MNDPARSGPSKVELRCWGTRGSIASPGPDTVRYGGNTPCLEVRLDGRRYIFDGGSGVRALGREMVEEGTLEATIFLSHFHWDHIQGLPFFEPLYHPEARLTLVAPPQEGHDVQTLLVSQMGPTYFPIPFSAISAAVTFIDLGEGEWEDGNVRVRAMRVRHSSFAVAYRLDAEGGSVCVVPDNELVGGAWAVGEEDTTDRDAESWRARFVAFTKDADILVHDAMFTEDEYRERMGWGHSTFAQTVDVAQEAGVGRLLFFHHAPDRTDEALDAIVGRVQERLAQEGATLRVAAAREGETLEI